MRLVKPQVSGKNDSIVGVPRENTVPILIKPPIEAFSIISGIRATPGSTLADVKSSDVRIYYDNDSC
jgi:hypothetical protein